jgi:ribosome-associated protein
MESTPDRDDPAQAHPQGPSKTQRKQQMHALQELGERLVALGRDELRRIDLPANLLAAIEEAQRITAHEGRRRQLQYVGRLMRQVDPEPIREALARATGTSKAAVAWMHRCEALRDRLLADDGALTTLLRDRPGLDVPWLRATIRAARREATENRPPRHARELYRWLHQQLQPEEP